MLDTQLKLKGTVGTCRGNCDRFELGMEKYVISSLMTLSPQRGTMRRRYEDDGISDDEIEGKRTFDLEEKLHTNKYNANFVTFMEGKG